MKCCFALTGGFYCSFPLMEKEPKDQDPNYSFKIISLYFKTVFNLLLLK